MRRFSTVLFFVIAGPALAETSVKILPASADAAAYAASLSAELAAALAPGGERAGCPLRVDENGEVIAQLTHVVGPPEGWSLTVGPTEAPLVTATGGAGELAMATTAILDHFCPPLGDAAYKGPWTATGGGAQIVVTGTVEDLLAPFTLTGEFPGGTAVFEYTPVNMGGGAVDYSLSGSGVTGSGEGIYSLNAMPGDVYVLEQTTDGCIDGMPNSCRTNSESITLTPGGN